LRREGKNALKKKLGTQRRTKTARERTNKPQEKRKKKIHGTGTKPQGSKQTNTWSKNKQT